MMHIRLLSLLARLSTTASAICGLAVFLAAASPACATILYVSYAGGVVEQFDTTSGADLGPIVTGLNAPGGLAIDGNGNVYVANKWDDSITKIAAGGSVSVFASGGGLSGPYGLTVDGSGNLFAANLNNNTISRIAPDGTVSLFASGLSLPYGLAFDTRGDLYAANEYDATIARIAPDGSLSLFASGGGMNYPVGLAYVASNGNLYAANSGSDSISEIAPDGSVRPLVAGNGLSFPLGLASDENGDLYAANLGNATISKIAPDGTVSLFAHTTGGPVFIAVAPGFRAVPEPATCGLVLWGAALCGLRVRPRRAVTS